MQSTMMRKEKGVVVRIIIYLVVGGVLIAWTYIRVFKVQVHVFIPSWRQAQFVLVPNGIPANIKWKYAQSLSYDHGGISKCTDASGTAMWFFMAASGIDEGSYDAAEYTAFGQIIDEHSGSYGYVNSSPEPNWKIGLSDCTLVAPI